MCFDCFCDVPTSVLDIADDDANVNEEYRQLWADTSRRIMEQSEAECLEHSLRTCACGSPAVSTSQLPIPVFRVPGQRVVVMVDPLCRHMRYRTRAR